MLRRRLAGVHTPLMGTALYNEFEFVLSRRVMFRGCVLSASEREALLDAFLRACRWTRIYYSWRPNLSDETDNHVLELAVAGAAQALITRNIQDFGGAQVRFPDLRILRSEHFIKE